MGLIDTIKGMRVAELEDKNMAIVVIILNVVCPLLCCFLENAC